MPAIPLARTVVMTAVLFAGAARAADAGSEAEYRIPEFKTQRVFLPPANRVWEPGERASAVSPESLGLDPFILRRKYGAREYALFPGRLAPGAYAELFAFRLDSLDRRRRMAVKFYSRRGEDWYRDLEDVYFLGDLVLAGQPLLYARSGGDWKELRALARKPSRLVIRSNPPGARIWLDGRQAGTTPFVRDGLAESHVSIRLEAPGHYAREEPVGLPASSEAVVDWTLSRLLPADTASTASDLPWDAWARADAPSLEAYDARQQRIRAEMAALEAARGQSLIRFDSAYPKLKPREEFEKSADFEARARAYQAVRDEAQGRLTAKPDSALRALRWADSCLEERRRPLEMRLSTVALEGATPVWQRYDPDREQYPFRLEVARPPLIFRYAGKLDIRPDVAKRLKDHPDSLRFSARYWNLGIRAEGALVFPSIDSLWCAFAGMPLRIVEDTLEYPGSLAQAPGFARAREQAAAFARDRERAAARAAEQARAEESSRAAEERQRARQARKAKWRAVRLYSGLAALAVAGGAGTLALVEKARSEKRYDAYLRAQSPQGAAAERQAVQRHDRNALALALGGGLGVCIAVPLSLF